MFVDHVATRCVGRLCSVVPCSNTGPVLGTAHYCDFTMWDHARHDITSATYAPVI